MKVFSNVLKKFKSWIFIDEFDEIYTNTTTRTIFVLYCFCGGFCFHNDVRPKFRKVWIIFNIFNFLFGYSSCIFYLIKVQEKNYYAWLLPAMLFFGLASKFAVYAWVYLGKDLLLKLINFFNNVDEAENLSIFCTFPQSLRKPRAEVIVGACFLTILYSTTNNFENYISYENYFMPVYPIYFPYEKTITFRIAFRIIQNITILPELILFVARPALIATITVNIYHQFELLGLSLRQTSYSVLLQVDEAMNLEVAMDETSALRSLSKIHEVKIKKALALDELTRKTIIVIERHQELYRVAKLCAAYLEYEGTMLHAAVFLQSTVLGFFISSITQTAQFYRQIVLIAVACELLAMWLVFCFIGELFEKMNEIIATEIYESPWYLLQPKDRRLVHTFLTMIQRPISISVYGLYPAKLFSFPDTLNTIYSQVKVLRTLQFNKQKH